LGIPNVRDLIKAGFHFGHRTSRWNPKMAPFIFKRRNLIHIIDLRATLRGLITGRLVAEAVAARGQFVLFVGTKKQASSAVIREAQRCGMPYVSVRWLGGLLTNFVTIRKRLDRLAELEGMEASGQIDLYSKKEVSSLRRERRKIVRNLGGVREMARLPGLLVIVDPAREHIAVQEANKLGIPIIALADTDSDPDHLDVIVPGNDDSFGAIEIFVTAMADAVREGVLKSGRPIAKPAAQEAVAAAEAQGREEAAGGERAAPAGEPDAAQGEAGVADPDAEPAQESAEA
jgi:small subunit ribosomal protein S2